MEEAQTNGCIEQDVAWLVGKWEVTSVGEGKAQVVGNLDQKGQCFFQGRSMCLSRGASETNLRGVYCRIDAGLSLRQSNIIRSKYA
jgi:hypothetical protein